jgi:hypothetical protein
MSLYVDDPTLFMIPTQRDLSTIKHLLQLFGDASRLIINLEKTEIYPIRCHNLNIEEVVTSDLKLALLQRRSSAAVRNYH